MKRINLLVIVIFVFGIVAEVLPQGNYATSLHSTRKGKIHWYNKIENGGVGGFEVLTNVPITQLGCVECHDAVDANGNQYPANYTPSCVDCHATNSTWAVTQNDCLGCHSREKTIINMQLPDVHRTAGFTCLTCHKKEELHGDDGVAYNSMFDPGAIQTDCSNSGCHAGFTHPNPGVDPHGGKLHCTSCHAQTNLACYSCHFESQVQTHLKRPYKQITGFIFLVNRTKDNKVHPATFQAITYEGKAGVAFGPSVAHTIVKTGARTCSDCHANFGGQIPAIQDFNSDGVIKFATWNAADSTLSWHQGIVPLPANYQSSLKMDYLTYNGNVSDPVQPSKNWSVVKDVADMFQIMYCTPLTKQQMAKIGMDTTLVSVEPINSQIPSSFALEQNYPNPFNPSTTIRYSIPNSAFVELKVYDGLGNLIQTLVSENLSAGNYEVQFNGANLASGIYYYQIKAGEFSATKKLVLMK